MTGVRSSRSVRVSLLTSAAGFCLALAPAAHAEINEPTGTVTDPEASSVVAQDSQRIRLDRSDAVREAQASTTVTTPFQPLLEAQANRIPVTDIDREIVIANAPNTTGGQANTTVSDRDSNNFTGIGQMIVDQQNGFIGLCTGTLINPRTVIFAAHCVNDDPANSYGQNSGGKPIAFGFSNNNNQAGNSAFGGWLGNYATNTTRGLYDVNYVAYNPRSNEPDAAGFLYADVAIASLDTPAKNIPTWAMLFSALPDPGTIGPNGTGYHVNLAGYGNNGTASTGSTGGIDYRRRLAENMLGALASLDQFENFIFGGPPATANPQALYWIDFDDPRRGSGTETPYDFNAWRDNAVPANASGNSQEGITASGDSGGPLILDRTYSRQLVIGVLSGGYTRFFSSAVQPANGYGTAAFYQPLFLYWDWVAANNPYHYVSATAGNGNWTDPTHWVSNVDPNYFIIGPNGQLVNGVPGTEGATTNPVTGFGQACLQGPVNGGFNECYDIKTGTVTTTTNPIGQADGGGATVVSTETLNNDGLGNDRATVSGGLTNQAFDPVLEAQAGTGNGNVTTNALPAPTIDNGLPGATNFVPNNSDGDRLTSTKPRYFDVTLSASGTTTLSSAVTIDRFGIAGAGAMLDITSAGSLTSLMDINQITGTMQVNGLLTSPGDYFMMAGGLNGTGTITTPFFTSVAGTISPGASGAANNVGTLTFRGNIILSSGNTYLIDLGASGTSDRIVVNTNGSGTGIANLGGRLNFNINAATMRAGNTYTILTAQGGFSVGSKFIDPAPLSGILTPKVTYSATAVTLTIQAGTYGTIVPQSDKVGFSYALLLDRNRVQAGAFDSLYGPLDLQSTATIRSTLEGLRPATETTIQSLAIAGVDSHASLIGGRIGQLDPGSTGGTFARYGSPNQVAAVGMASRSAAGLSGMGFDTDVRAGAGASTPLVQEGALPEGVNGFVAGGYLKGDAAPANGVAGRDDYDGWYVAAGIETWDDHGGVGFAFSYTSLDGTGAFPGTTARASLYQGSLYSKYEFKGGLVLDSSLTAGLLDGSTRRSVSFVGTPYTLRSNSGSLIVVSEVGLGVDFDVGAMRVTPRVAGRATHIGFSRTAETGGPMALMINRAPINSVQGRAGISFQGTGAKVRPFLNGTYVHEFNERPGQISANFVGGVGGNVLFDLNSEDPDYFEVSGGLTVSAGSVDFSVSAETTRDRQDLSGQAYRGSLSFKF
jgi:V8-like Glu-specific endopeptidase